MWVEGLPQVIGIAGRARSGKDSVASVLTRRYGYTRYAFADPLKAGLRAMFGLSCKHLEGSEKEEPLRGIERSPRYLMQTLGTEWGRELVHPDLWLILATQHIQKPGSGNWVISDVRFENEAAWVREHGLLLHVERSVHSRVARHKSEAGVERRQRDGVVWNIGTLQELDAVVVDLVRQVTGAEPGRA